MLLGGLGFAALLLGRLWSVDDYNWIARDDAVITLSHAKNAADFGTIGVSPGDRVEGFSSPLQFAAAFVVESVSSPSYRSLSLWLLIVALVAGGVALAAGSGWLGATIGLGGRAKAGLAVGLPVAVAVIVATSWTASGWLGSGMENPWLVAAGFAVVGATLAPRSTRSTIALAVVGLFALSIGRVEFAAFTPPVILATAWVLARRAAERRRLRVAAVVIAVPLLGTAVVHVVRRLYFGEWLPNTAVVQGRSNGVDQIAGLAMLLVLGAAVVAAMAIRDLSLTGDERRLATASIRSVMIVFAGLFIWWSASGRTAAPIQDVVLFPPLLPLLVTVGVLLQLCRSTGAGGWPPTAVFAGLTLVPPAQYVVMGPARLDGYRVLSIVVPVVAVWIVTLFVRLWSSARVGAGAETRAGSTRNRQIWWAALTAAGVTFLAGTAWGASNDRPRYLNYAITGSDRILAVADAVRDDELDGSGLPLLANPDLGKISFAKRAIITDLGLLGDPVLTLVVTERNDLMPRFLTEVAHPDVVEVHGGFSCAYGTWLASTEFGERHASTSEAWVNELDADGCFLSGRTAVWLRTDAAPEYELARALAGAEQPVPVVSAALAECDAASDEPFRCEGVRRSVQRVAEGLRDRGELDEVIAAFEASPSADLARALLRRGPGWGDDAFEAFVAAADVSRP